MAVLNNQAQAEVNALTQVVKLMVQQVGVGADG